MTRQTTHKRAKSKFNMPLVVSRVQKKIKKKHKKKLSKPTIRGIWKDIVEHTIIEPLLKDGFVQVDRYMSLEIVGRRIKQNTNAFRLMSKGLIATKTGLKPYINANQTRRGITYRIEMIDTRFGKGRLIFHAGQYIKKRVTEELKWTNIQYRIDESE